MKILRKTFAVVSVLAIVAGCVGCKKKPSDDTSSEYWVYESEVVNVGKDKDNSSVADNTSSSGTVSGNSSTTPSGSIAGQNLKSKYKNLKGRKITVVGWWDATQAGTEEDKLILEVEKLFNCNMVEKKLTDYKPLYTSILSGNPICDLFVPRDTDTLSLANKNMLTALDTVSTFDSKDSIWNPAAIAESTLNGHIYGMTAQASRRDMLVYNKDMFTKNGWTDLYSLSRQGKLTWDSIYDVITKAAKVDAGGNVLRYGLAPKYDLGGLAELLINMNGVAIISREGDTKTLKNTLTSAPAVNALQTLRKWNTENGYMYDCTKYSWTEGVNVFKEGKAAMAIVDESQMSTLKTANFTVGAVVFPHGPDTTKQTVSYTSSATVMPAGVKNPEDVILFWSVREAYNVQHRKQSIFDTLSDPSVKATYDAVKKHLWNKEYTRDFAIACDVDAEDFRRVAAGSKTPQEAIHSVQNVINGKIKDFWK